MEARDAARQPTVPRKPCHRLTQTNINSAEGEKVQSHPRKCMTGMLLYQGHFGWKGRLSQGDHWQGGKGESTDAKCDLCVQREGRDAHDSLQAHVVHSPRSDEVGKILHDFQGKAFLLQSKLPLVGRVEGNPKGIQDICQQFQAGKTHRKKKQKLKE